MKKFHFPEKKAPKAIEDDFDSDFFDFPFTSVSRLEAVFPSKHSDELCDLLRLIF